MAWLTNWNRRKSKIINGTTVGFQTSYQMKFTVHKGAGTDTATDVYLGTNVRDDFGDVRFTSSDGSTLLPYWIESYTPGVSAMIWVSIDYIPASPNTATIYIYYDNPTATTTSNGEATFDFFDDFSTDKGIWTKVDPNNRFSYDTVNKRFVWTNLPRNENAYVYTPLTLQNSFVVEYAFQDTSDYCTGNGCQIKYLGGVSDGIGVADDPTTNNTFDFWHRTWTNVLKTRHGTSTIYTAFNTHAPSTTYYITRTRDQNGMVTMNVYSDSGRTTHVLGTPVTQDDSGYSSGYNYLYLISSFNDGFPEYGSGWIDDIRVRKYVNPEPTYGSWGSEEMYVCPLPSCNLIVA